MANQCRSSVATGAVLEGIELRVLGSAGPTATSGGRLCHMNVLLMSNAVTMSRLKDIAAL